MDVLQLIFDETQFTCISKIRSVSGIFIYMSSVTLMIILASTFSLDSW